MMSVFKYTHFFMACNSMTKWSPSNVRFLFTEQRLFSYRLVTSPKPHSSLLCKNILVLNIQPSTINFMCRSYKKNFSFRKSVSSISNISKKCASCALLCPVLKFAGVVSGRNIRKWWRSTSKDREQFFQNEIKAIGRKIGIALSLILCLSVGYNLGHMEITPERHFNEKYKHLEITDVLELLLVRPLKITPEIELQRKVKRRHFKEKYKHLETIDVLELLQVGPFKIAPESELQREVKRRNFNQKYKDWDIIDALELLQHELDSVSFDMPNSWDTHHRIEKLLSQAYERVLNHGVDVSFTLLVDLISFVILLFMWVLVPKDRLRTNRFGV